jgi:hypothetical protein
MGERERRVLTLRYGLEDGISRTLGETAKHFGITRERVRQIEVVALRKLRALMQAEEQGAPQTAAPAPPPKTAKPKVVVANGRPARRRPAARRR